MGIPNKTHCLLGLNNIVKQNKQASGRAHHGTQLDPIIRRVGSNTQAQPDMWSGRVGFGSCWVKPVFHV